MIGDMIAKVRKEKGMTKTELASIATAGAVSNENDRILSSTANMPEGSQNATMKGMNNTMPLMSVVMCMFMPAGVGLYWAASSGVRYVQQILVNMYMKNTSVEDIVKANIEKQNKKRAKKGLAPIKENAVLKGSGNQSKSARVTYDPNSTSAKARVTSNNTVAPQKERKASPGGIAAKAGMVKNYNEKSKK